MRLYTYILTLCHDNGRYLLSVRTASKKSAIKLVCNAENYPKRAIIKIIRK